ncbi:MAG: hypothetical protein AAGB25_02235 [Pseudomonadota bacterium]
MRKFLMGAAALSVLAACGGNGSSADFSTAASVLEAMDLDGEGGRVSFDDVSRSGGSATFSGVSIADETGETTLTADSFVIEGMTMTDGNPGFEKLTFTGLAPVIDDEEGVSVSLGTLTLIQPNAETAAFVASLFADGEPGEPPAAENWAFEKLAFEDFSLNAEIDDPDEQGTISINLDEVSVSSLADMIAGKALLEGLTGEFDIRSDDSDIPFPLKGNFKWDKMSVDGLRGEWLNALIEADGDPEAMANLDMSQYFDSPIEPGYDGMVMEGLSLDVSGATLDMPQSEARVERNNDGVATRVFAPRTKFTIEASPENGGLGSMLGMGLGMMGYDGLELYGESDARFDPETDETRLQTYNLGMTEGFDLSMTGGFQNLMAALSGVSGAEPDLSAFQDLTVNDFAVTLKDESLLNRALNVAALTQGADSEELRGMAVMGLAFAGPQLTGMGVDEDVANELLTALSGFIQEPGELSISVNPSEPLRLGDISDPSELTKETLGFAATHSTDG